MPQAAKGAEPVSINQSLRGRVSAEEWQARVDLAAAYRFCGLKGWQDAHMIYNHLSVRVPDEPQAFLIKAHDILFEEVTASNLRKVRIDGPMMTFADNVNPAGWAVHGGILEARPDVQAIMHLHSVPGAAVSALEGGLMCVTQEAMQFHNRLAYHDFDGVAEIEEREPIVRDLGQHNALVLRNHGLLTCGRTVGEAVNRLFHLIRLCEIQLAILATGKPVRQPSEEVCEKTAHMFLNRPANPKSPEWLAVLRWLDRHDPSYRD